MLTSKSGMPPWTPHGPDSRVFWVFGLRWGPQPKIMVDHDGSIYIYYIYNVCKTFGILSIHAHSQWPRKLFDLCLPLESFRFMSIHSGRDKIQVIAK